MNGFVSYKDGRTLEIPISVPVKAKDPFLGEKEKENRLAEQLTLRWEGKAFWQVKVEGPTQIKKRYSSLKGKAKGVITPTSLKGGSQGVEIKLRPPLPTKWEARVAPPPPPVRECLKEKKLILQELIWVKKAEGRTSFHFLKIIELQTCF